MKDARRVGDGKREPGDASEILAVRLSSLGDLVLAFPALAAIKQAHPGTRLTVLPRTIRLRGRRVTRRGGLFCHVGVPHSIEDALLFLNVDARGQPHPQSLHAGLPPTRGEKWVLSMWVRDRVQPIL